MSLFVAALVQLGALLLPQAATDEDVLRGLVQQCTTRRPPGIRQGAPTGQG